MLKKLLLFAFVLSLCSCGNEKRASPPESVSGNLNGVQIQIDYGAPSVRGRKIFGDLVPFDKIWRTGANENTIIQLKSDAIIGGSLLKAGSYGLFTTPGEQEWKVHFNEDSEAWGAYAYSPEKDVAVVKVKPTRLDELQEKMRFRIASGSVFLEWENTRIAIPVSAAQ